MSSSALVLIAHPALFSDVLGTSLLKSVLKLVFKVSFKVFLDSVYSQSAL